MRIDATLRKKIKRHVLEELKKEEKKSAVLITPYVLTDKETNDIVANLPFLHGREIERREDKALIAGFVVTWGSKILDASLAGRLDKVATQVNVL